MTAAPAFTCPDCGAVSHNPNDALHSYCARCKAFKNPPPPTDAAGVWQDFQTSVLFAYRLTPAEMAMAKRLFFTGIGAAVMIMSHAAGSGADMQATFDRLAMDASKGAMPDPAAGAFNA